jgi:hypothetical protein
MKKIYLLVPAAFLLFALQASAIDLDTSVEVKAKASVGGGNATSSVKSQAEVKSSVSSSTVSAEAREIRGWSDSDKKAFLTTVKTQAQLRSGQDLENFAKGVMLKDENVTSVSTDSDNVEVRYKLPAKFLGIFGSGLSAITNVKFESDKFGRGPKEVTVKFPWYRMFFSLSSSTQESVIKAAVEQTVQVNAQTPRDNAYAQDGITVNLISSILKGIRAELTASTTVKVK